MSTTSPAMRRTNAPATRRAPARPAAVGAATRDIPPLTPGMELARAAAVMVAILAATFLAHLLVLGRFQHSATQHQKYSQLRAQLAEGTAPIGPVGLDGTPLSNGTPVALLEIPRIGLKEVVVEGTSPSDLFAGPGHRRDTPLPGQEGTSILMGRRAMFGGPFSRLASLQAGDVVKVTTGQGAFMFTVTGQRKEGDPVLGAPDPGTARLTLATAAGRAFMPDGILRVDAELQGTPVGGDPPAVSTAELPREERLLGSDTSTLWVLVLWLQILIAASVAAVWAWHRWGKAQAWVVGVPVLTLLSFEVWNEMARLLPNLA